MAPVVWLAGLCLLASSMARPANLSDHRERRLTSTSLESALSSTYSWCGYGTSSCTCSFITMSEGGYTGTIPSALGDCTSLFYLDLSENALTGTIPEEFSALTGLSMSLNLAVNSLRGDVKPLRTLTSLLSLELQDNRLNGTLAPLCLLYTSPSPRDGLLSRMPSSA